VLLPSKSWFFAQNFYHELRSAGFAFATQDFYHKNFNHKGHQGHEDARLTFHQRSGESNDETKNSLRPLRPSVQNLCDFGVVCGKILREKPRFGRLVA
jgi:hypothetical protein